MKYETHEKCPNEKKAVNIIIIQVYPKLIIAVL